MGVEKDRPRHELSISHVDMNMTQALSASNIWTVFQAIGAGFLAKTTPSRLVPSLTRKS
jgi:hypothetical protein